MILDGSPTVNDCRFLNNKARIGGAVYIADGSPTFKHCEFRSNGYVDSGEGGAIYVTTGSGMPSQNLILDGCKFYANTVYQKHFSTGNGGALYCGPGVDLTVIACRFQSNYTFHNTTYGNATTGGAISFRGSQANIWDSLFFGNYSSLGAGIYSTAPVTITNSVLTGNRAVGVGCAGPECNGAPDVFSGYGGGIYANTTNVTMVHCTLQGNWAAKRSAAAVMNGTVDNSIIWGNVIYPVCCGEDPVPLLVQQVDGAIDYQFSCVQGVLTAEPGEDPPNPDNFPGCIDEDPLLVENSTVSSGSGVLLSLGDLKLQPNSPCIDAGDNNLVALSITEDIDGYPRFEDDPATSDSGSGTGPIVDMGASEYGLFFLADFNRDRIMDLLDVMILQQDWLTGRLQADVAPHPLGDGLVNYLDYALLATDWTNLP